MAQKVNIILVDDLTGEENATQTVTFGLDGTDYEIDLNDTNADALRESVEKFIGSARKVTGGRRATPRKAVASTTPATDTVAVREWAKAQGMEVSERGRIPAAVQEAYAAQSTATEAPKGKRGGSKARTTTIEEIEKAKESVSS